MLPPATSSTLFPYTTLFRSLCREILSELLGPEGHLIKANPDNCPGDADLYLWDGAAPVDLPQRLAQSHSRDRKSTRLNSSHLGISYAVFCLKKKKEESNA